VEAQPVVEEIVAVQPKEQPKRPIRTEVVEAQPVVEEVVAVQPKESSNPTPRPSRGETTEEPKITTKIAAEDGLIVEEVRTKSSRPKTSRGSVVKTEKSNGADLAVVIEDTKPAATEPVKKNKTIESVEYNESSVKSFVTPTSEKTPKRTVESEEAATGMSPEDMAKMKLYQEAVQKAKEDNHRGAVNLYDQLLQKDPNFIMAYLNRGISRNAIEDFNGSIADLDKVIKQKPDMPEAYYSRGNTYYDMQEFNKAIEDFNTVIELRHDYVQAYMNRALSKRNLGDTMGCCEDWQKAKEFGSAKAKKNIEIYCPNEKEKAYNEQQQKLLQQGTVTPP
jgi:TolA-binding protein